MNAAEILFEAYDLLPVPDEKEFLRLIAARVNPDVMQSVIEDAFDGDQIEGFLSLFLTSGDIKELRELQAIYDIRQQRKRKARQVHERAERIKANAAKPSEDPNNPYTNENSLLAFLKQRLGDKWYIAGRPLKKYRGTDYFNITQAKYNKLHAEYEALKK